MPRITITVPGKVAQPYRFSLDQQIVYFGRGEDNDIQLDSGSVSAEHAVMERIIGGYVLTDLGSTNGIKLSGERVKKIHLRNDQLVHIGDVEFGFELNEEEMSALCSEDPTSRLPAIEETAGPQLPEEQAPAAPSSPEIRLQDDSAAPPRSEPEPERPVRKQPRPQSAAPPEESAAGSPRPNLSALVAVLAVIAFVIGVAMHFERKTGVSLLDAIQYKLSGDGPQEAAGNTDSGS